MIVVLTGPSFPIRPRGTTAPPPAHIFLPLKKNIPTSTKKNSSVFTLLEIKYQSIFWKFDHFFGTFYKKNGKCYIDFSKNLLYFRANSFKPFS